MLCRVLEPRTRQSLGTAYQGSAPKCTPLATIFKCRLLTHSRGVCENAVHRYAEYVEQQDSYGRAKLPTPPNPTRPRVTNSIKMTNAEKLIQSLEIVGTNANAEPIVKVAKCPYLGEFIVRCTGVRLSLGEPCIDVMLFDAENGKRVFTASDDTDLAKAKSAFENLEYVANNKAIESVRYKTSAIVDAIGFLGR